MTSQKKNGMVNSPAYGDASKATYGGLNLFLIEAGVFEGTSYGGPVGAVAGTVNTIVQGVDLTTPKLKVNTPLVR